MSSISSGATPGADAGETLAAILGISPITGPNDIVVTNGQKIDFGGDLSLERFSAFTMKIGNAAGGEGALLVGDVKNSAATPKFRLTNSGNGGLILLETGKGVFFTQTISSEAGSTVGLAFDSSGLLRVTDGDSALGSLLVALGTPANPSMRVGQAGIGLFVSGGGLGLAAGGVQAMLFRSGAQGGPEARLHTNYRLAFGLGQDLSLKRIAPGHLQVLNDTNGQANNVKTSTIELTALSGASVTATGLFPDGVIRLGVSIRVTTEITGATSFDVGDGTDVDLFAAAVALTDGTTINGSDHTASPLAWLSLAGDVVLTAVGSDFTAGAVRIVAHYLDITPPTS